MSDLESSNLSLEETLEKNGEISMGVSGRSMMPMLRDRKDMVVIKKLDRPLKRHDVAVYRMPTGKLLIHRVLKVREDCFVIRGDNRPNTEYIKPEWIIGVLKEFHRNGKRYDCETNKLYKAYIIWVRASFPVRRCWYALRDTYVSVKRRLLGQPKLKKK